MSKKYAYRFVAKSLIVSLLSSTMIHALSDEILETQLLAQYQSFSKLRTVSLNSSISPAVQFVQHLMQTPDVFIARKLALLIGKGVGVGGVGQHEATEEEKRILFSGLSKSKEKGGKKEDFLSKAASSAQLKAHQEYLTTAYELLPSQTSPFVDFLKNNTAYQAFNQKAKVHHAVKTKNWQELATELSPEIRDQLKNTNSQITAARQVQLTEYVFTLPKTGTDRSQFIGLAFKLLRPGKDEYNQEVLKGLIKLKTSVERQKFATQVLDKRFWEKDEKSTCLKVQMATAKLPDSLFYKLSTLHEKVGKVQLEPNQLSLVEIVASVPAKDQAEFVENVSDLVIYKRGGKSILEVASLLKGITNSKQRAEFVRQIKVGPYNYINWFEDLNNAEDEDYVQSLSVLASVPSADRENLYYNFRELRSVSRQTNFPVIKVLTQQKNEHERDELVKQTLRLSKNTSRDYYVFALKALAATPKHLRESFIDKFLKINPYGNNGFALECLSEFSSYADRQVFMDKMSKILKDFGYNSSDVLQSLNKVPVENRSQVLTQAYELMKDNRNSTLFGEIIECLSEFNNEGRERFVKTLSQVLSLINNDHERSQLIKEIKKLPVDKRNQVLTPSSVVIKDNVDWVIFGKIINFFHQLNDEDACKNLAQPLSQILSVFNSNRSGVMNALETIPANKRADVVEQAAVFAKFNISWFVFHPIIKLLSEFNNNIDKKRFAQPLSHILSLIKDDGYKSWFVDTIRKVSVNKRADVVEQAALIIKSDMESTVHGLIIECLGDFNDQAARKSLTQPLSRLLSLIKSEWDRSSVINDIRKVPVERRSHVVEQTSKSFELISPNKKDSVCKEIIQRLSALNSDSERKEFVESASILMQLPNMDKDTFFDIWEVTSGVAQADRGTFVDNLSNIILEFDTSYNRRQVLLPMKRLAANNRLSFVQFINDNQVAVREHIEALAHLTPDSWTIGLENLREDRRKYSSYSVKEVKSNQVYQKLDSQAVRVNRSALSRWKLPEIEMAPYTADQMQKAFANIVKGLNLTDSIRADYVSAALLDDSSVELKGTANRDKFYNDILPQVSGFLKTLWGVSLSGNEKEGWQMYDDNKPAFRKALSYILEQMMQADAENRMMLLNQLVNGLLHCPTGQKEAVDTVVQSLVSQTLVNAETFQQKLDQFLAVKKNEAFRRTMMSGNNSQNVHILSYYHEKLSKTLGLSSSLGEFKERIGRMGHDPFSGYEGNALQAFYQTFNPSYLTDAFHSHVQTKKDFALQEELETLKGKVRREKDNAKKEQFSSQLNALRQKYTQITRTDRPFTATMVYNDLMERGKLPTDSSDGWERYFSDDPIMSTDSFELTRAGARQYLIDSGLLLEKAK